MKTQTLKAMFCLAAMIVIAAGGCRKKSPEGSDTASGPDKTVSISNLGQQAMEKASGAAEKTAAAAVEIKEKAVEKVLDIAQQFQADQTSTVPDITARAKEMAVENLRKMAEKYRDAIAANQQKLKELTEKLVALDAAQKDSPAAKSLQTTIDQVYKGLAPLKERFQVYYDALKAKAGDLTGLEI